MYLFRFAFILLLGSLTTTVSNGQGVATDQQLQTVTVSADRVRVPATESTTTVTRTAADLRLQNLFNPEDALKYVPNLTIRKRYIGDRNALLGGRSFSTLQAPRGLVFMDGYLLSNFLGRFDAPRWNMVSPEEIARVDVQYGPFSALYPGNSIGTTVVVETRKPAESTAALRTSAYSQSYAEYGLDDTYNGYQLSAYFGTPLKEGWWSLSANRQDSLSQPMQYFTVSANASGEFPAVITGDAATPVSGVVFDTDPNGFSRAVFGANAGAIDRTQQDLLKLRAGYSFGEHLELEGFIAGWRNETRNRNRTFLRDSTGTAVWDGTVSANGVAFVIPAGVFAPSNRDETHLQHGLTLATKDRAGWNGSLVWSRYEILDDTNRVASVAEPQAASGGTGFITRRDGTSWETAEAQGVYDFKKATETLHRITVGLHLNSYYLSNPVLSSDDWRTDNGTVAQDLTGKTSLRAIYLQDRWQLAPRWTVTAGLRHEQWRAYDGEQVFVGVSSEKYASREISHYSPKLAVAYQPDGNWTLRAAWGRGLRFPTVAELFQGTNLGTTIQISEPNLAPERSVATELVAERAWTSGFLRTSLFQDDIKDTIWNQSNTAVFPAITNTQNVGRVRTRGIETQFEFNELWHPDVRVEGNIAWSRSKILESNFVESIGKEWLRIPRVRATLAASWQVAPNWLLSSAIRHSGKMYSTLTNTDINADTFGGVSKFTIGDIRVMLTLPSDIELSLGIDNLSNERAYQFHPYPGRTVFLEGRWTVQ